MRGQKGRLLKVAAVENRLEKQGLGEIDLDQERVLEVALLYLALPKSAEFHFDIGEITTCQTTFGESEVKYGLGTFIEIDTSYLALVKLQVDESGVVDLRVRQVAGNEGTRIEMGAR
jgi:hypothetical protein